VLIRERGVVGGVRNVSGKKNEFRWAKKKKARRGRVTRSGGVIFAFTSNEELKRRTKKEKN